MDIISSSLFYISHKRRS